MRQKKSFRFSWHGKGQRPPAVNAVNVHHAIITHTHTHSTNTLWQRHNMQSGVPYRVCIGTELGWSQRADRVNSGVNCVSGGTHRDVTLPPGDTKRYTTTESSSQKHTHTHKKSHLGHMNHNNHKPILNQCRSLGAHGKQQV